MKKLLPILVFIFGCCSSPNAENSNLHVIPNCYVEQGRYDFSTTFIQNTCGDFVDTSARTITINLLGGFRCGNFLSVADGDMNGFPAYCELYYKWRKHSYYGLNTCDIDLPNNRVCSYTWEMKGKKDNGK